MLNKHVENEVWVLQSPIQYIPEDDTLKVMEEVESQYLASLTESYEIFRKTNVDIQGVTAKDAKEYINHLKKAGLPYNEELSEYYKNPQKCSLNQSCILYFCFCFILCKHDGDNGFC